MERINRECFLSACSHQIKPFPAERNAHLISRVLSFIQCQIFLLEQKVFHQRQGKVIFLLAFVCLLFGMSICLLAKLLKTL